MRYLPPTVANVCSYTTLVKISCQIYTCLTTGTGFVSTKHLRCTRMPMGDNSDTSCLTCLVLLVFLTLFFLYFHEQINDDDDDDELTYKVRRETQK